MNATLFRWSTFLVSRAISTNSNVHALVAARRVTMAIIPTTNREAQSFEIILASDGSCEMVEAQKTEIKAISREPKLMELSTTMDGGASASTITKKKDVRYVWKGWGGFFREPFGIGTKWKSY